MGKILLIKLLLNTIYVKNYVVYIKLKAVALVIQLKNVKGPALMKSPLRATIWERVKW